MKMVVIAALLITLPAIAVVVIFFGQRMMLPALASLCVGTLPFVIAGWLVHKSGGAEIEH